jgi:chloride channel protein, CIC family
MTVDWKKNAKEIAGTGLIGLSAGLAAVFFHRAMLWLIKRMVEWPSEWSWWKFSLMVLGGMAAAAFITGLMMKYLAPDAPGSGIPQVKAAYHSGKMDFTWRLIFVKFFGGVLSIGSGSSLGREGPTIHIGAAIASKVAKLLGEGPAAKANAVCAGSAAGLAAAFSSPLAGVTLVLEEIAGGKNQNKFAGRSLFAAALASSVVYALNDGEACLPMGPDMPMHWKVLWLSPLVALVAGAAGLLFQWTTLGLRKRCQASPLSRPVKLTLGALGGGLFALIAFGLTGQLGVFALGEEDLLASLHNQISWPVAACLMFGKIAATSLCYGSGGCGGIFAPIIFFGSMAGIFVHGLAAPWFGLTPEDQTLLALVGMTACLSSVVRAPLTSILIVMEMTWQIHVLPALMVAAVIGVFLNRTVFAANFYDETLRQDGIVIKE